jgi:hypothetical protein
LVSGCADAENRKDVHSHKTAPDARNKAPAATAITGFFFHFFASAFAGVSWFSGDASDKTAASLERRLNFDLTLRHNPVNFFTCVSPKLRQPLTLYQNVMKRKHPTTPYWGSGHSGR